MAKILMVQHLARRLEVEVSEEELATIDDESNSMEVRDALSKLIFLRYQDELMKHPLTMIGVAFHMRKKEGGYDESESSAFPPN